VVGASGSAWSIGTLAVILVLVVAILALATLVPAGRAARQPVTEVLRDVPPEATGVFAHGLPNRMSFLGVREASTRPGRSLLTALAVAVAVIGAIVASGFVRSIDRLVADPARTGDPWNAYAVVGDADAEAVAAAVAETPGVASSFPQADARGTLQGGAFLLRGVGGAPGFDIGEGRLPATSGEALAGYGFLTRFGVDVGDAVTVDTAGGPVTATIVGWYRDTEDAGEILIVPIGDLAAVNPDADVVYAVAEPGVSDEELAQRLAPNVPPGVRVKPYVSETEGLDPFRVVLWLVAGLLALVAGANLLATLLATTRESARSLGVLGSVGFTPLQLVGQGAMAAGAIAAIACAVGVPLGVWLYGVLLDGVTSQIGLGPGVSGFPSVVTLAVVVLLALALAAGLGALATARMARLAVSDLVRWE
jgi:putative ABC transport system permease protein